VSNDQANYESPEARAEWVVQLFKGDVAKCEMVEAAAKVLAAAKSLDSMQRLGLSEDWETLPQRITDLELKVTQLESTLHAVTEVVRTATEAWDSLQFSGDYRMTNFKTAVDSLKSLLGIY
jgi:hypothetical protein